MNFASLQQTLRPIAQKALTLAGVNGVVRAMAPTRSADGATVKAWGDFTSCVGTLVVTELTGARRLNTWGQDSKATAEALFPYPSGIDTTPLTLPLALRVQTGPFAGRRFLIEQTQYDAISGLVRAALVSSTDPTI